MRIVANFATKVRKLIHTTPYFANSICLHCLILQIFIVLVALFCNFLSFPLSYFANMKKLSGCFDSKAQRERFAENFGLSVFLLGKMLTHNKKNSKFPSHSQILDYENWFHASPISNSLQLYSMIWSDSCLWFANFGIEFLICGDEIRGAARWAAPLIYNLSFRLICREVLLRWAACRQAWRCFRACRCRLGYSSYDNSP